MPSPSPPAPAAEGATALAADAAPLPAWPRPRAVPAVSAHWEAAPLTIGCTTAHHALLYDYYGFPKFMYELRYPAPGAPRLADRVEQLLGGYCETVRKDRGLDHGAFIPPIHLLPDTDVPVLGISMPATMSGQELYDLGGELPPLRDEGVCILATGNLVHDLRGASWEGDAPPPQHVLDFDAWVERSLTTRDHGALCRWMDAAPEPLRSHPSAGHYRPLLVAAGAAGDNDVTYPVDGFEHGTISRRSVQFE
ncbi:MAG: DODA-type extradiol aromatic ring-opening family dioxygenase [Acidimicrobiia bacterium]